MCCTLLTCAFKFIVININGDNGRCSAQLRSGNCSGTHTAAPNNGHGFSAFERTRIENGTQACGHTAPEQPNSGVLFGGNIGGNFGALARSDQGFFGERANT